MLKWITLAIISSHAFGASSPSTFISARSELQKVAQRKVINYVNELVSVSAPSRMIGMPGHEKAKTYIFEAIKKADAKSSGKLSLVTFNPDVEEAKRFYQKDFDEKVEGKFNKMSAEYSRWNKFTKMMKDLAEKMKDTKGDNIIWEKSGLNSNKVLIITAHYDTISFDAQTMFIKPNEAMPGANYNASGVAVALSLIDTLSQFNLNYSVQVAFLDWQGIGYLGSYQYAKELKDLKKTGKEIIGVMNLEMLGQDTSYLDKVKKNGNMSVYTRPVSAEENWVKGLQAMGGKVSNKVTFELKPNSFENSDTFRFWEQDLKAATFSQNWEEDFNPKFYQTPLDTPETLNHETLYNSYLFIGGGVLGTLLDLTK
jgi:Peptidase family M28